MILAPRLNWRRALPALALGLALTALLLSMLIMGLYAVLPVSASAPAAGEVAQCDVFATAGTTKLYRCLDEDYGYACFVNPNAAGMIFCLEY